MSGPMDVKVPRPIVKVITSGYKGIATTASDRFVSGVLFKAALLSEAHGVRVPGRQPLSTFLWQVNPGLSPIALSNPTPAKDHT